jgi:hypothetical protein
MKKIAIVLLSMCTLSAVYCRAESFTHIFDDMAKGRTLTFPYQASSDYTVGVTDQITYTCSDGGGFGFHGLAYCIALPAGGGVVQTSPAVENLTYLKVTHTLGSTPTGVRILISTDNSNWTDITSPEMFNSSSIEARMPAKGNYYLKIENSGSAIKFLSFHYAYDPCHCLRVVSE